MASPMALSQSSRSSFTKRSKSNLTGGTHGSPSRDAAALLAAVKQADARARERSASPTMSLSSSGSTGSGNGGAFSPLATPALSMSSSITRGSEDTVLRDDDDDGRSRFDCSQSIKTKAKDVSCDPYVLEWGEDNLGVPRVPPTSEQTPFDTRHTEFGHCWNDTFRHTSAHPSGTTVPTHVEPEPPYYVLLTTYLSYIILILIGHIRDFVGKRGKSAEYRHLMPYGVSISFLWF
jgi:serine palmitoyltransferase